MTRGAVFQEFLDHVCCESLCLSGRMHARGTDIVNRARAPQPTEQTEAVGMSPLTESFPESTYAGLV